MSVISLQSSVVRKQPSRLEKAVDYGLPTTDDRRLTTISHQITQFFLVQIFHDFTNILRLIAGSDQQRVFGLNHDQVIYAKRRHKFARRMNVVPLGVEGEPSFAHESGCHL